MTGTPHFTILGAGVAGSVLAHLLTGLGHRVTVLERDSRPGGMCRSFHMQGFVYEYGPHILALHNSGRKTADYLASLIDVVDTQMTTAASFDGRNTCYPPNFRSAEELGLARQVRRELAALPPVPDETNFETYLVSRVGRTLYSKFFESFTRKFWGVEPSRLSAEWAKIRHLGEDLMTGNVFYNKRWCAYPRNDWNDLFDRLLSGVTVLYGVDVRSIELDGRIIVTADGNRLPFEFLISTKHLDRLFDSRRGDLRYAGYRIEPVVLDRKPFNNFDGRAVAMTYYPQADVPWCRVTDYGAFQQKTEPPYDTKTIVTYETPDHSTRLYPFTDRESLALFDMYLRDASQSPWLLTFGRMGLYKYLTADTTVEMAFRVLPWLAEWSAMNPDARYNAYRQIRGDWNN
jgi:UDP-galactopyranose mutase